MKRRVFIAGLAGTASSSLFGRFSRTRSGAHLMLFSPKENCHEST